MKELWHITEDRNTLFILSQGLIPLKRKGLMRNWPEHERPEVVWLTDNPSYIYTSQVGKYEGYVTFKVDVKGLEIEPATVTSWLDGQDNRHELPCEFWYRGTIAPDRLTIT